jgi:hypothetical protein
LCFFDFLDFLDSFEERDLLLFSLFLLAVFPSLFFIPPLTLVDFLLKLCYAPIFNKFINWLPSCFNFSGGPFLIPLAYKALLDLYFYGLYFGNIIKS